jgi:DNA polymerase III delta subunit
VRKLESQARRFSANRLVACIGAIHQTDLALKGAAGITPELAMERLVIGLAR